MRFLCILRSCLDIAQWTSCRNNAAKVAQSLDGSFIRLYAIDDRVCVRTDGICHLLFSEWEIYAEIGRYCEADSYDQGDDALLNLFFFHVRPR